MTDTITILGRTLKRSLSLAMYATDPFEMGPRVALHFSEGAHDWLFVGSESREGHTECVAKGPRADLERLWLERASLETPRLCVVVTDGMNCPKCEGRGDVSYDRDYGTHIAAVEHECHDCEGTGKMEAAK
jgi:hypothetical protein